MSPGGLPGFLLARFRASLTHCLAGASDVQLQESRRRSVGFTFYEVVELLVCYDTWIFDSECIQELSSMKVYLVKK